METTPNLELPYILAAQAQKHVTHNEALRMLDAVVHLAVTDRDRSAPPAAPAEGDRHIVAAGATGPWAGRDHTVAAYQDGGWLFYPPKAGWVAWIASEGELAVWHDGEWQAAAAPPSLNPTDVVGINATANTTNRLAVASPATLLTHEGAGHQLKINKLASGDTASVVFQTAFAGRAEMGLAGDDNYHVKVSADGSAWHEAIVIDRSSGAVALPNTTPASGVPSGGTTGQVLTKSSNANGDAAWQAIPTTPAVDAGTVHLYDRELGRLGRRAAPPGVNGIGYNNGQVTLGSDFRYTAAVGGDCFFDIALTPEEIAATDVHVMLRVDSGTFSQAYVDQLAGTTIIASTTQNLAHERDRYLVRNLDPVATCTGLRIRLRNIGTSAAVVFTPPGVGRGQPATAVTSASLAALDQLMLDDANEAIDRFSVSGVTAVTGTPGAIVGKRITMPAGSLTDFTIPVAGLFSGSDTFLLLFRLSAPVRYVQVTPHTGIAGGAAALIGFNEIGNGWYMIRGSAAAAAGAAPARFDLRVDNRSVTGITPVDNVALSKIALYKNVADVPGLVSTPGVVTKALADAGVATVYVDAGASDANPGSRGAPVATIAKALELGASRILLRKSTTPHRTTGITLADLASASIAAYAQSGDTAQVARLWGSTNVAAAGWTATSADATVYYRAASSDPKGVWEVAASGAVTRMGTPNAPWGGRLDPAVNEAEVRANAGSWWFGAGSMGTGIYIKPYAGMISGKSYEIPACDTIVSVSGVGRLDIDGVEIAFARNTALQATRTNVCASRARFTHTGALDAVDLGVATIWQDTDCAFEDAGDDGMNSNGSVQIVSIGSIYRANRGDGMALHGTKNVCRMIDCAMNGNFKDGFVTIGTGTYTLSGCRAEGNVVTDIAALLGAATEASDITLDRCTAGATAITADSAGVIASRIIGLRSRLQLKCVATVSGLVAHGSASGDLLHVIDGDVMVSDARLVRGNRGVRLDAGTLTLARSQVLRNVIGVYQAGGTLMLDAADPVNVYANTTAFSGVSAADQAKTVSVAAV